MPMSIYGAPQLAAAFRTVRKNTIQIAEDIPESNYNFAAAPGFRTARQLLLHIAASPMIWTEIHAVKKATTLAGFDFGSLMQQLGAAENASASKSEIVAKLKKDGEAFADWLGSLSDSFLAEMVTDPSGSNAKSRLEGLMSAKEHEMHHRGQLMVVERLLGIEPHLTRQMREQMMASSAKG